MDVTNTMPSAAQASEIFAAEIILPVQFFAPRRTELPEKRLMLAVLQDAALTLRRQAGAPGAKAQRAVREIEQWMEARNRDWPFSFENLCSALNFDPSVMRRGLRAMLGAGIGAAPLPLATPGIARRVAGERHRVSAPRRHRRATPLRPAGTLAETA